MKKLRILLIIIACLILVWFGARQVLVRNVFDEMYYGHDYFKKYRLTEASYRGEVWLEYRPANIIIDVPGKIQESFPKEYVNERIGVGVDWELQEKTYTIAMWLSVPEAGSGEGIGILFQYNRGDRRLIYLPIQVFADGYRVEHMEDPALVGQYMRKYGITREDIEELSEMILYKKVLTDWFRANEGKTRFSLDNLGQLEIINNQFPTE